jgi:hypothetical protein
MAAINSLKAWQREHKADGSRGDGFSIHPSMLVEQPGFNPRDYGDQEVIDHIEALKQSYIAARYVPPLIVSVIDGDVVVREGHCRRRAVLLAIDEGHDIKRVRVEEHKGGDVEQTSLILTSNDGLKLKPLQRASVYARLQAYGLNDTEIAKSVGCTGTQVARYLTMLKMPEDMKRMVNEGKISASYALDLYSTEGSTGAVDKANAGLKTAEKAGKKTVTPAAVNQQKRLPPKTLQQIRDALLAVHPLFDRELDDFDRASKQVKVIIPIEQFQALAEAANSVKSTEGDNDES